VVEIKKTVDHGSLHWSAYYKNYYQFYENGKENAGYYPEQDRQVCIIIYNKEYLDDYDTKPDHPNDQEQNA
jgi:hypothetical protein